MEATIKNTQTFAMSDEVGERVFAELKTEIGKAFKSLEKGEYIDASEVEAKWGVS
jgi:hypothetical protein